MRLTARIHRLEQRLPQPPPPLTPEQMERLDAIARRVNEHPERYPEAIAIMNERRRAEGLPEYPVPTNPWDSEEVWT